MSDLGRFEDNAPFGQDYLALEADNFSHAPTPLDTAAIHQLLSNEQYHRGGDAAYGMFDMYLSVKGMMATTLGATLQQELMRNPAEREIIKGSHAPFALMAEAPFDWKGVTLALGAFALTNAATRVRNYHRMDQDSAKALAQIYSGEQYIPATKRQAMVRRAGQRIGRGAVTAAACYGAYKVGEQLNTIDDLYGGVGLAATGMATIQVAKHRAKQFSRNMTATMRGSRRRNQHELDY